MPRAKGGSIPPPRVVVPPGHGGVISALNANDVLSGRGGRINNHPGNITFRTVVEDYKREYLDPRTRKLEKAHVAARLVAQIRSTNPPGRFLREDPERPGCYVEIGDQKAWKKAGQALREDAPDVRKEIDEEMEQAKETQAQVRQVKERTLVPPQGQQGTFTPTPQQQHQPGMPYPPVQQQQPRHGVPPGIPPSVSYSPNSQPMQLSPAPAGGGGGEPRPDPPEAPGVTGFRQPPLRYFESGRGAGGRGQPSHYSGRGGRGHPPHHQQHQHYQQQPFPPRQGYHHHQNFYNNPRPPSGQHPPHQGHFHSPPPQFQHPQYQHQYHQPNQPPSHGGHHPSQYNGGPSPQPQFAAPALQDTHRRKKSDTSSSPVPVIAGMAAEVRAGAQQAAADVKAGAHHAIDAVTGIAHNMASTVSTKVGLSKHHQGQRPPQSNRDSRGGDFPNTMSVGTDFTMSDISTFGDSRNLSNFGDSRNMSNFGEPKNPGNVGDSRNLSDIGESIQEESQQKQELGQGAHKQSSTSKSSSGKSRESFTMSDLLGSGTSLLGFGRTRSFPDLMLSTGDLLPPLPSGDSDKDLLIDDIGEQGATANGSSEGKETKTAAAGGRLLRAPFHRHSSSESSNRSLSGFHPIKGGVNVPMSNINDAMSIMSLDSRRSARSESSSWMEKFESMQSIGSDMNPWGSATARGDRLNDETGSVRSFLSDVSNELSALDLAEPLLPPILNDPGLNDSGDFVMARPDP